LNFLDEATDGIKRGEVWIIAGNTGAGKTTLALQIANSFAENPEHNILFCSLEMTGWEVTTRLFCAMNGVNYSDLKKGIYPPNFKEMDKVFTDYINKVDFEIVEYGYSFQQIVEILKNGYEDKKPDVIFVDFIQHIEWIGFRDERMALTEYIRKLAELAKKQNIAVVVISQLRRLPSGSNYQREPDLIDLKGSGALEQMASKVIFTYGTEETEYGREVRKHYIHLAKNRQGNRIKEEVRFIGSQYRFEEIKYGADQRR
jgi:replicative DNA helicase